MKPGFVADNIAALGKLTTRTRHCAAVVGYIDKVRDLFNAAAVSTGGEVVCTYRKHSLPNYGVFDEYRYFQPGDETPRSAVPDRRRPGRRDHLRGHLVPRRPLAAPRPRRARAWS